MKQLLYIFISFTGIIIFSSCEEDEIVKISSNPIAPEIISPTEGQSISYTEPDANSTITFVISPADYGFEASINYEIQIDKVDNTFKDVVTLTSGYTDTLTATVDQLNTTLLSMKFIEDVENSFEMRVMAVVSAEVDTLYSETILVKATPYLVKINYPDLQVPGAYQGWDPANADSVESVNMDDSYEGYIWITAGEFKFTQGKSWDTNWGDDGDDGTLDPGGANISVTEDGFYKININLKTLTYTILKTEWGLIGSATPGGWDADTDMTYNETTGVWELTVDLIVGEIKFRANDDWDLNYGDGDGDGKLDQEGDNNIAIPEAGNYTVTFDVSHLPYTYSLIKN